MKNSIAIITLVLLFSCKNNTKEANISEKKIIETTQDNTTDNSLENTDHLKYDDTKVSGIIMDTVHIEKKLLQLTMIRKAFDPKNHKINSTQSTINGEEFFGTDGTLPKYELAEAFVVYNNNKIILDTSKMFNPWLVENHNSIKHRIIITKSKEGILIFGRFSNTLGLYAAEWIIKENSSERLHLDNDQDLLNKHYE